jgi:dienelactone hydrolase
VTIDGGGSDRGDPGSRRAANDDLVEGDDWITDGGSHRNFSPWAQVQLELAAVEPVEAVPTEPGIVPGWRARTRGRLTDLLGEPPRPVALAAEITDSVACGSYTRHRVVFDTEPTMSVPAYLLVPNARRARGPAVLAIHGHGPGKAEVAGLDTPEVVAAQAEHHGDYAHRMAEAGYVVMAPDLRCFGERADPVPTGHYLCDANLVAAVAAGRNPLADNLHDLVCALDLLSDHPLVDPSRIGVVGFSYGGTMALFLSAWDTRVRATIVSGYFSSWKAAHRVPYNLCGSQVLVGMLGQIEHVDIAGLVAPRALLVESGTEDFLFPIEAATESMAELAAVYAAMRAPIHALEHHVFEGGHRWDGATSLAFFDRWL